jgi:hypothetical protein
VWRSKDGKTAFEKGPNPFLHVQNPSLLRHSAVKVVGDKLYVFYSRVGDLLYSAAGENGIGIGTVKIEDNKRL